MSEEDKEENERKSQNKSISSQPCTWAAQEPEKSHKDTNSPKVTIKISLIFFKREFVFLW